MKNKYGSVVEEEEIAIMNTFLKNFGTMILLIGALWLIIPFFSGCQSNTTLLTGLVLVVLGFILYVVLNKKIGFRK